jgi:hypothetical protein
MVERLLPGDDLDGVAGHAPHDLHQARLSAPPGLVVWSVLADGVDQVIPLELIRIGLRLGKRPGKFTFGEIVPLVDPAFGRRVHVGGDDCQAPGPVGVAGEFA